MPHWPPDCSRPKPQSAARWTAVSGRESSRVYAPSLLRCVHHDVFSSGALCARPLDSVQTRPRLRALRTGPNEPRGSASSSQERELLNPPVLRLERRNLGHIQVALRIGPDVMERAKLSRRRAPPSE